MTFIICMITVVGATLVALGKYSVSCLCMYESGYHSYFVNGSSTFTCYR